MNDYSAFSNPDFDANEYANAVLAGESYPSVAGDRIHQKPTFTAAEASSKEEISTAISKLTFGIDDVSKQIKTLVSSHHEDFLAQASSASNLSGSLTTVRTGLTDLDSSLEKLRLKIQVPYQLLQSDLARLQKLQEASDVLRRTSRFVILARRLQSQVEEMESSIVSSDSTSSASKVPESASRNLFNQEGEDEKERAIAKAALSIAELVSLLDGHQESQTSEGPIENAEVREDTDSVGSINLRTLSAVSAHVKFVEDARIKVTSEMENMVLTGLATLNQSLLASSLQTAHNLRVLPELVQSLVLDLSQAVEDRIRNAFDLSKIAKSAGLNIKDSPTPNSPTQYRSRVRTEPTSSTAAQYTSALWARLETLIQEMADCCVKVYTLEKVLRLKKDPFSRQLFLDEAMTVLEDKPSTSFWSSLGRALEKHSRDAIRTSTFLQQTFSTGYPKLLRLFHEFFAKIAVHTDTVYTHSFQSPETVLILRAISNFESLYLSRSSTRLNEAVSQAFSGGTRSGPGVAEGVNIARAITNEFDAARFDPLLVVSVAKNATSTLESMLSRTDGLVVKDRSAVTFIGPTASPQQALNASLANCLFHCWQGLSKLEEENIQSAFKVLKPSVGKLRTAYEQLVDPIVTAMRRELGAIIARLHRIDFSKVSDAMAGGGASFYMKDLAEKLSFIKVEILSKYTVGDDGHTWMVAIIQYVIRTFVLHVSIAKPLGESGKLQLTTDMTELEFGLNAFLVENMQNRHGLSLQSAGGDDYVALRAMRQLLFLENKDLPDPQRTVGLPPLIVLHHILVRSPIPLPHSLHGWHEAEYVRWVDDHSEGEACSLIESGLSHWEKVNSQAGDSKGALEYVALARKVLKLHT